MTIEYVFPKYRDKSVHNSNSLRVLVARQQQNMRPADRSVVKELCEKFFKKVGMKKVKALPLNLIENPIRRGFYHRLKELHSLEDKRDIIWIKFTKRGHIGVIATSADINLCMNNTSGKIISLLQEEWNEEIMIFPLKGIPSDWNRQRLESALGNYLIANNIPILDYFSHNL